MMVKGRCDVCCKVNVKGPFNYFDKAQGGSRGRSRRLMLVVDGLEVVRGVKVSTWGSPKFRVRSRLVLYIWPSYRRGRGQVVERDLVRPGRVCCSWPKDESSDAVSGRGYKWIRCQVDSLSIARYTHSHRVQRSESW